MANKREYDWDTILKGEAIEFKAGKPIEYYRSYFSRRQAAYGVKLSVSKMKESDTVTVKVKEWIK